MKQRWRDASNGNVVNTEGNDEEVKNNKNSSDVSPTAASNDVNFCVINNIVINEEQPNHSSTFSTNENR